MTGEPKKRGRKPVKPTQNMPKLVRIDTKSGEIELDQAEIYDIESSIPKKTLFGIQETALQLDMSEDSIRRWIDHRLLVSEKIVGSIKIPRSEIVRIRVEGRQRRANQDR